MHKTMAMIAVAGLALPGVAAAKDSTGCGVGTMVFDGKEGVAPQVLAVTTNGTLGNQTFGISSGTLGCDSSGMVDHMAELNEFTGDNMDRLAADVAAGEGETLATMADLLGVASADRDRFNRVMQQNFARIFPSTSTTAGEVIQATQSVMAADSQLSTYLS